MPVSMVLAQSAITEGGELFPTILLYLWRLYIDVYSPVDLLVWAPAHREFPLGKDGEGLRGGNLSINGFSKLGTYTGRLDIFSPTIARMNNYSPSLTNFYLDTPPVGPTLEPLDYTPLPGRLGQPHRYPQTRTGDFPQTGASKDPPSPPPPPPRTYP